jgi:NitT/TauT family transport system ATP-binding protein
MALAIGLVNVGKVFTTPAGPFTALLPVSETIAAGEFFSLIGPSGCGKTTLLRMISGLLPPSSGQIDIGGQKISGPLHRVSFVFQRPTLLAWRTVLENILLPVEVTHGMKMPEARKRAAALLELLNLTNFANSYPSELSGGMQQRVSIARALIDEPEILLMDEPFSALDEFTREHLNDELHRLHVSTGKTVVFVTHNISEAVFLSTRVGVMAAGPGRLGEVIALTNLPAHREASLRKERVFFDEVTRTRAAFDRLL